MTTALMGPWRAYRLPLLLPALQPPCAPLSPGSQMLQGSGLKEQAKQAILQRLRDPHLPVMSASGLVEHALLPGGSAPDSPAMTEDRGPASRRVAGGLREGDRQVCVGGRVSGWWQVSGRRETGGRCVTLPSPLGPHASRDTRMLSPRPLFCKLGARLGVP